MAFDLFKEVAEKLKNERDHPSGDLPELTVPKNIRTFLGQLGILKNIPLYYLIPDEKYLPQTIENEGGVLRLFWLDKEWIECLIDGALSLGEDEDRKFLLANAMAGNYVAEVYYDETKERIKKQLKGSYSPSEFKSQFDARIKRKHISFFDDGQPKPTIAQNNWCYTGFFMRSTLISSWVGVEVIAKGNDPNIANAPLRPLQVIRLERISHDTLFCLCEGIVRQVEIVQPPEAFHFGLTEKNGNQYQVNDKDISYRGAQGVINITKLKNDLEVADSANFAKTMAVKPLKVYMDIEWNKAN